MSEFKGVPGPWTIGESSRHGIHCVDAVDPKDGLLFEVCEVWGIDHKTEETQRSMANARLIAAAPELLSLLKEARSTLEMWKDVAPAVSLCADIDKTIAKALGEDR